MFTDVEYYKAYDGTAQEIFHNQDDFIIVDNKKVIIVYSLKTIEIPKYASTQFV